MSRAGDIVKEARLRSRLSQRELARRAGTSQAAISRIERGLEEPTLERLEQVLAGLGWKLGVELEPIEVHDMEPWRLRLYVDDPPGFRIEGGINWISAGLELQDAVARAKS